MAAAIIIATFLADTYPMLLGLLALTFALGGLRQVHVQAGLAPQAAGAAGRGHAVAADRLCARRRAPCLLWMTTEGWRPGSKACLRLMGVALPLILMLSVTKLVDLANACVEVLHIPYRYAFTFTTALRFVPCSASR
jgi:energy-coupling factor transport system permease protein